MREVLTISLPTLTKNLIKRRVKQLGCSNVSNYIQLLLQQDQDLITEKALLKSVRVAQREYRQGKSIRARSIKDLL